MQNLKQQIQCLSSLAGINMKHPELCLLAEAATTFLPTNSPIARRFWHIMNDKYEIPNCPACATKPLGWISSAKLNKITMKYTVPNVYSEYCSMACRVSIHKDEMMKTRRESMMAKYGVENPMHLAKFKEKCLNSYNLNDQETIKAARMRTNMDRYGTANAMHSKEVKAIHSASMLKVRHTPPDMPQLDDDTLRTMYVDERRTSSDIANQFHLARSTVDRMIHESGIKMFNRGKLNLQSLQTLKDRDKLVSMHVDQELSQTEIAEQLGVDISTVSLNFKKLSIQTTLYRNPSKQEHDVAEYVHQLVNEPIVRNTKQLIKPLELDIYVPSHNLAIEYCGLYWHSSAQARMTPSYHKDKMDKCTAAGIRLITIFEDEWVNKNDVVKAKLASILKVTAAPTVFARKCQVVEVSSANKSAFFNAHHIQGDGPGSITYGLQNNGTLIACMTFIKQSNNVFTLNRYATSCHVPGGFSKLMKYFTKQHSPDTIISFADLRWSTGKLYATNGFTLDKVLPPDYYWVVDGERQHKFNWRHNSRLKLLTQYDPTLSETANMTMHGHHKIYQCGLQRWVWTSPTIPTA